MLGIVHFARADELPEAAKSLKAAHAAALLREQKDFEDRRADLYDRYASALDPVLRDFKSRGDLDHVMIVIEEQKAARLRSTLGNDSLPAFSTPRATLFDALAPLQTGHQEAVQRLTADYLKRLDDLKKELTRFGRIVEAVAVDAEIKQTQGATATNTVVATSAPPTSPGTQGAAASGAALLAGRDLWWGIIALEPGRFHPRNPIILGSSRREDQVNRVFPLVTSQAVTEIDAGVIFIDEGRWNASGTRFASTKISIDLGGALEATACLFEDCEMHKGGAWFVEWHSAKWSFTNCVFSRRFIRPLDVGNIGVKAVHCTFHGIELPPIAYREDAGTEALHEWMIIKDCRFIGCTVPESFLLATKDCVFEGCRFGKPEGSLPMKTPLKLRAFVTRGGSMPKTGDNRVVELQGPDLAPRDAGAILHYRRNGKTLQFD